MENNAFIITTDMLATRGQRFANFVVDAIVKFVIRLAFVFGLALINDGYYGGSILSLLVPKTGGLYLLVGYGLSIVYYFLFEAITQRTIGKYITNTIVINIDGDKPDLGTIFKRTLCRIIPFEPFSFFRDDARGWHDTITDTIVVDVRKYNEALNLKNSFSEIGTFKES